MKIKTSIYASIFAFFCLAMVSCSSDDDGTDPVNPENPENPNNPGQEEQGIFVLGLGVTTATETTNYVVEANDLMNGTISLQGNGMLQDGYRDYAYGGNKFYSIGGLGITDVNTISASEDNELSLQDGLTFPYQIDGFRDLEGEGTTMVGISLPQSPETSSDITFYRVDIASNTRTDTKSIPVRDVYNETEDWIFHTGMQLSGDKIYQTFYPVNSTSYATVHTDTQYVAIYNYPDFTLDKVITDTRFGPAGSFNTRSGIFATEDGDVYTISNSNFGFSQATKPAGILKILAGTEEFDADYSFNTEEVANGGKIIHALYIGDDKLFAAVSTKTLTGDNVYVDANLKLAIVDLENQTITPVEGAPEYTGNGGRSFAAFQDGDSVYSAIKGADGIVNIYKTDIESATATKGAEVEASFVGGIAKLD